jgi:flagellar protein FliL
MANPEAPADDEPAKPSSKGGIMKWALISVGMFVLVTISQAVAPLLTQPLMAKLGPQDPTAEGAEVSEAEKADPVYAPLNPPLVVNFANDPNGFMQVEVQVMARDKHTIDVFKANEPAVRNALLMLYAGKSRDDVTDRAGKEKLRAETLTEVQKVIEPYVHDENIEDVYFTSLIAQ